MIMGDNDIYQDDATFSIVFDDSESTVSSIEQEDWDESSLSSMSSVSSLSYTYSDINEIVHIQAFENFLNCDCNDENDAGIDVLNANKTKTKVTCKTDKTVNRHVSASAASSFLSSIKDTLGFSLTSNNNDNRGSKLFASPKRKRVMMARLVSQDLCRGPPLKNGQIVCPDSPGALTAISDSSSNSSSAGGGSSSSGTSSSSHSRSDYATPAVFTTTTQDALLTRHTLQVLMKKTKNSSRC